MKAWTVTTAGPPSPSVLTLTDHPIPTPLASALLIKVTHAALNPVDLHLIKVFPSWLPFRRNPIPGMDFAGEIVALGPSVPASSSLKIGTRVCGALNLGQLFVGKGSLVEYVTIDHTLVAEIPEGVTGGAAAGMGGIAGQTAALIIKTAGGVKGKRLLINGASGGVGSVLVQACKGLGAELVVGVCSGANEGLVKGLGAHEVVDYTGGGLEEKLKERFGGEKRLDFILDCAGSQRLFSLSEGYLNEGGRFISIVGGASQGVVPFVRNKLRPVWLGGVPRGYTLLLLLPSGETVQEAVRWLRDGVVKETLIDSEFGFEDAVKAYQKLATGRAKGKVIVRVSA
ncbi:hypothetical protein OQA88_727 [Cercophora sp. LCS_1]